MNIENIQCFVHLAQCLNFAKAAEIEHITQSAMSRKISSLEEELNVVLFYRDNRQVALTHAGQEFYNKSVQLLELYHSSVKQTQNIAKGFKKELKIGLGIYEHTLLNNFLKHFILASPHIKISCTQFRYKQLMQQFNRNLLDIIITSDQYLSELLEHNIRLLLVNDSDWNLGMNKDNSLATCKTVSTEQLINHTLITMYEGSVQQIRDYYKHAFSVMVHDVIYVNSHETKLMLMNANLGVGLLPSFITPVQYSDIVVRPVVPAYRPRRFYAICKKDNPSIPVNEFMDMYEEFCDNIIKQSV